MSRKLKNQPGGHSCVPCLGCVGWLKKDKKNQRVAWCVLLWDPVCFGWGKRNPNGNQPFWGSHFETSAHEWIGVGRPFLPATRGCVSQNRMWKGPHHCKRAPGFAFCRPISGIPPFETYPWRSSWTLFGRAVSAALRHAGF